MKVYDEIGKARMITVNLGYLEVMTACMVGIHRWLDSVKKNRKEYADVGRQLDEPRSSWDIPGAIGECAAAKYFDVHWDRGVNTFKKPDVGTIQIRSTDRSNGRLILRERDVPEEIYVLALTTNPFRVQLAGWLRGADGMKDRFATNPNNGRPCWMVPQSYLHDMGEL
jgi:hypothetical protein